MNWIELNAKFRVANLFEAQKLKIFITKFIGAGSWGQVFSCQTNSNHNNAVVKIVPIGDHLFENKQQQENYDDPTSESAFLKEAKMVKFMGRHNIGPKVWAYDIITFDRYDKRIHMLNIKKEIKGQCKFRMIVMEKLEYTYCEYKNLIRSSSKRKEFTTQVIDMFEAQAKKAFLLGIVHADLHSGRNIMLNTDNNLQPLSVKLIDWAITITPVQWYSVSINNIID